MWNFKDAWPVKWKVAMTTSTYLLWQLMQLLG